MNTPSDIIVHAVNARMLTALPRLDPGQVYVLRYRDDRLDVTKDSPSMADRRRIRSCYVVDVTERRIRGSFEIPAKGDAYSFHADLDARWRVEDPEAVVQSGLADGHDVVASHLRDEMWKVGRGYGPDDAVEAESAMRGALDGSAVPAPGLRVDRPVVRLRVDTRRASVIVDGDTEALVDVREDARLARLRRIFDGGGLDSMILLHLVRHPEDTRAVVEMIGSAEVRADSTRRARLDRQLEKNLVVDADVPPSPESLATRGEEGATSDEGGASDGRPTPGGIKGWKHLRRRASPGPEAHEG